MIDRFFLTTTLLVLFTLPLTATVFVKAPAAIPALREITTEDFINTEIRDMEVLLGTDLNWKEKWGLRIIRKKLKKAVKKDPALAGHSLAIPIGKEGLTIHGRQQNAEDVRSVSGLSLLSFLSVAFGYLLFIAGTPLGILFCLLAPILGIMGLSQIRRNREKFGGGILAWLGIIFGGLTVLLAILAIAAFGAG